MKRFIRLRRIPRLFKPWMNTVKSRGAVRYFLEWRNIEQADSAPAAYLTSRGRPGTTGFSPWGSIFCLSLAVTLSVGGTLYAGEEDVLYSKAVAAARQGSIDFAFMYYNSIARDYPRSRHREEVLFARGEYYFRLPHYAEAKKIFDVFLQDYPDSKGKLFALACLYRVAQSDKDKELIEKLRKEIVTFKQVGLIFKEFKDYNYRSPLYRVYRAVFHIDRIEFYVGGELFAEVPN